MPIPGAHGGDRRVRRRIVVGGSVQGIGFRPFVYRLATARGLAGWVRNSNAGVIIEVEGAVAQIAGLLEAVRSSPPRGASVSAVTVDTLEPRGERGFTIEASECAEASSVRVLPDLASCEACLAEMRDPGDRRYRYPFINCTSCGPRYSIIQATPYDRQRTSMGGFVMCADCRSEYEDPGNRRFHAEPNACPACGPRLALWDAAGAVLAHEDAALHGAASALRGGRIVAVKGVGGFHLMVDARDDGAVRRLRARKQRPEKPFAVMFPTLSAARASCRLNGAARELLTSSARPIVLVPRRGAGVAASVAPDGFRLGALLPYAPLHYLLLDALGFPVVATSGNSSGEPIATDENDALTRLAGIADLFLVHDRPIVRPVDDSVAQIVCGEPQLLRRARGYAPAPVQVPGVAHGILAVGGHLKSTVAMSVGGEVVVSQHLGDLETASVREAHRSGLADLCGLHHQSPRLGVRDLHPDYASSRGLDACALPVASVQHHVAHVAACLAENALAPPALGVAWDGGGYGPDGTIWGGEFLLTTGSGWQRVARLRPFRLPGGAAAVREPRRAALGVLYAAFGERALAMTGLPPVAEFSAGERAVLGTMLARGVNAPLTSSVGRLFDACAALCGLRQRNSYEGQAAMALEAAARHHGARCYEFSLRDTKHGLEVDWQPALEALLADRRAGVAVGTISSAVHQGLAEAIVAVARRAGEGRVALTGGCFQNTRLTEAAGAALELAGFEPIWHRRIPPNDGGIALGQAAWASWTHLSREETCA